MNPPTKARRLGRGTKPRTRLSTPKDSRSRAKCNGQSDNSSVGNPTQHETPADPNDTLGLDLVLPTDEIKPSPENDRIYRPFDANDPTNQELIKSIREHGFWRNQIIAVSLDGYIIDGHRRYGCAKAAGLTEIPCIVEPVRRCNDDGTVNPEWEKFLAERNTTQRVKSFDEQLREQVAMVNGANAHAALVNHRRRRAEASDVAPVAMELTAGRTRSVLTAAKQPMLNAIAEALNSNRKFWPFSVRQLHYRMLNSRPLLHASKSTRYANNKASYKALVDLVTRARLAEFLPWEAFDDTTRPLTIWNVHREPSTFIKSELGGMFCGYARDLMQSQPNHIEILGEKNTINQIIRPVAADYTIPYTISRGYPGLPLRKKMADRFAKSGKENLVVLILSDLDPDGQEIAESFARSMCNDFGIEQIRAIKVAITPDQVRRFKLPAMMQAKESSMHHARFVETYGEDAYELEALDAADLQTVLREAIEAEIDREAFTHEEAAEQQDAVRLEAVRNLVRNSLSGLDFNDIDGGVF